jgi:hypothetical protein
MAPGLDERRSAHAGTAWERRDRGEAHELGRLTTLPEAQQEQACDVPLLLQPHTPGLRQLLDWGGRAGAGSGADVLACAPPGIELLREHAVSLLRTRQRQQQQREQQQPPTPPLPPLLRPSRYCLGAALAQHLEAGGRMDGARLLPVGGEGADGEEAGREGGGGEEDWAAAGGFEVPVR